MRPLTAATLVALREIRERTRSRSYEVWTGLIAALAVAAVVALNALPGMLHQEAPKLGITPAVTDSLQNELVASGTQLGTTLTITRVTSDAAGRSQLADGTLNALLIDPATLLFKASPDAVVTSVVNRAVQVESLPRRLAAVGLTAQEAQPLIAPTPVDVQLLQPPKVGPKPGSPSGSQPYVISTVSVVLLLMSLSLYGAQVLNGVVEEKANRVVEVLLGTLHSSELLAGKVIGIVVVALIQMFAALGAAAVALLVIGHARIPSVAFGAAGVSGAWFVLGLLFFSFGFAAVGSTVSRTSDAQSAAAPMSLLLVLPYLAALVVVPQHPDGPVSVALSLFPITAPLAMPARFAVGHPPLWQLALAYALMAPAILGMVWLAGRVYRGSILHGGQRVRLLQAFRSGGRSGVE